MKTFDQHLNIAEFQRLKGGMKSFDMLIFDCDGVLVDSEVLACQCLVDVLEWHGVTVGLDEAFDRFLGRDSAAVNQYALAKTGRDLPEGFYSDLYRHLSLSFKRSLRRMPDVQAVLEAIDRPFCVASSSDPDRLSMTLSLTGLDGYFGSRVYTAAMVERSKPAPDLFLYAARQMDAAAARTLVIEDSINGVVAGKAAGMTVWGFVGGSHYAKRDGRDLLTEAGADRILGSMTDLLTA